MTTYQSHKRNTPYHSVGKTISLPWGEEIDKVIESKWNKQVSSRTLNDTRENTCKKRTIYLISYRNQPIKKAVSF